MTPRNLEPRYPCPVCLGTMMKKVHIADKSKDVTLDYCPRCGGMWFEFGEVQQLRSHPAKSLWSRIERRDAPHQMPCHNCQAIMDRNAAECPACAWKNVLQCPSCDRPLQPETHEGLRLDVCRKCKGVWFDHIELEAIWALSLQPKRSQMATRRGDVGWGVGEVLLYSPDLLFYGAYASGMALEGAATALSHAPGMVGGAAEAVGEAAGGVFEAIVGIIEGIFN
ncbi:MAG: zf-TFIIB domain-containing protein [Gemmatimonadaceae bacterium]